MAARPLFTILSLIFVSGALLLQFFIILSGDTYGNPENRIFFLQSSTNGIPGQRNPSRWTFFKICGVNDQGRNANCGAAVPALPFSPPSRSNFDTTTGVPDRFIGTRHFYYLSRFMFAFYLVSLFFGAVAFLTSALALCTRLGSYLSAVNTMTACFFMGLAAALQTAWVIQGRNAFRASGQETRIGTYALAFAWTSFVCYFLATITFCIGGRGSSSKRESVHSTKRNSGGTFGRKSSTRSRGSFVNKEDYS